MTAVFRTTSQAAYCALSNFRGTIMSTPYPHCLIPWCILFYSVRHKIQTGELDISEDYFLTCLYPRGHGNSDDVEYGFLRSGLLLKVRKTILPVIGIYLSSNRPFVLFSHHHRPRRHLMSRNLRRDQVERNRKRLRRRRQPKRTLQLFFIWMERSHQDQSRMPQPWYVFSYCQLDYK